LRTGVRDRASDIHIAPQDPRVRIRYRIDGALHDVFALPADMGPAVVSRIKVLADMNIVEPPAARRSDPDGDRRPVVRPTSVHHGKR
jgi:type IV pilus assembly protein PilB